MTRSIQYAVHTGLTMLPFAGDSRSMARGGEGRVLGRGREAGRELGGRAAASSSMDTGSA